MAIFAFSIENITFFISTWHANYLLLNMAFRSTFHRFGIENDKFMQRRRYYQSIAKTQFACIVFLCHAGNFRDNSQHLYPTQNLLVYLRFFL